MNDYYGKYKQVHEEVIDACKCIQLNNSVKLREEVETIKSSLDKISVSDWQDSVVDKFNSNKESCSNKLKDIIDSIDSVFKKSEEIYYSLNEQLDILKQVNNVYMKTKKPDRSDYREAIYRNNEDGTKDFLRYETDESKYQEAYLNWKKLVRNCEDCVLKVEEYFQILTMINDTPITSIAATAFLLNTTIPTVLNPGVTLVYNYVKNYLHTVLEGVPVNAKGASILQQTLGGSGNVKVVYYENSNKLGIRYNQGSGAKWNQTRIDGVKMHESGCGIISLAGVISSVLSNQNGEITYVTPTDLAKDLSTYSKTNGGSGLTDYVTNSYGLTGDYEKLGRAISEIYGVSVVVNKNGNLSYDNYVNITNSNTGIMYSSKHESHINAVFYANNNKVYECDTTKNCASYLSSGTNVDPSKRALYISSQDTINVENGMLTMNGSEMNLDIGNADKIIVDGKTYDLTKTSFGYEVTGFNESNSKYLKNQTI